MWQYTNYSELYHHGILGQKWGKRNGPPYPLSDGDHSPSERKAGWRKSLSDNREANKDSKRERRESYKNRRTLTNEEIRKRIERLRLEKELKTLTNEDTNPGRKAVKEILTSAGKQILTKYLVNIGTGAAMYLTESAVTKSDGTRSAFADAILRGGLDKNKKND